MVSHGTITHPVGKKWLKECKFCQEVYKSFIKEFGEDPTKWEEIFHKKFPDYHE